MAQIITQLIRTIGPQWTVRVDEPMPGAFVTEIGQDGKPVVGQDGKPARKADQTPVSFIFERPDSYDEDSGEMTPAHYEVWILPPQFQPAIQEFAQAIKADPQSAQNGSAQGVIDALSEKIGALPGVAKCCTIPASQVAQVDTYVPMVETWTAIVPDVLSMMGIELADAPDGSDDEPEEEAPAVQEAPAPS